MLKPPSAYFRRNRGHHEEKLDGLDAHCMPSHPGGAADPYCAASPVQAPVQRQGPQRLGPRQHGARHLDRPRRLADLFRSSDRRHAQREAVRELHTAHRVEARGARRQLRRFCVEQRAAGCWEALAGRRRGADARTRLGQPQQARRQEAPGRLRPRGTVRGQWSRDGAGQSAGPPQQVDRESREGARRVECLRRRRGRRRHQALRQREVRERHQPLDAEERLPVPRIRRGGNPTSETFRSWSCRPE